MLTLAIASAFRCLEFSESYSDVASKLFAFLFTLAFKRSPYVQAG